MFAVVKWNPFVKNCYNDKLVPYIQGLLHFGFIDENRAKMSRDNIGMEVGAGVGAGIAYTFTWMQRCWMLDLDGVYSMPNIIIQDDAHASLKSLNFGLTIGVAL